jgi:hypothetical protein
MAGNIDAALFHKVSTNAGVIALISTRFYPLALPQTVTLPAAVYQEVSGVPIKLHGEATVLPRPRFQITCWGTLFSDVVALDKAIKSAIDGKRESWGTGTYVTKVLSCVAETTPVDNRDPTTGLYQRSRDYFIRWQE